jgi:hypothetical protein
MALSGLQISSLFSAGNLLTFLFFISFLLRVSFFCSLLSNNGGQEMHQARTLPSVEGSPVASDAKNPSPASSGTPSPLGSLAEVSSRRPRSPVLEQGGPFEKAPMIDLSSSSDEEDFIADTSRDFEFTQRLYGELNRDLLGPPDDGKVIILSDSDDKKEEACEEKSVGAEDAAASSAVNPISTTFTDDIGSPAERTLTPAASLTDADDDPGVEPNDSSDDLAPSPKMEEGSGDEDEADTP